MNFFINLINMDLISQLCGNVVLEIYKEKKVLELTVKKRNQGVNHLKRNKGNHESNEFINQ